MTPSLLERMLIAYARKFPIQRGKVRLINQFWRSAAGTDTQRTASLVYGDYRIPANLAEMLQRQFYFFGTYFLERKILAHWQGFAQSAKVVFDVGANAGIYSFAAAAANGDAQIHAFEPTPEIATRLRAGVEANGLSQLHVHEAAVSSQSGSAQLKRWSGEGEGANEGMNFISGSSDIQDSETVATVSLDDCCQRAGIKQIDLMKMDIQGHEAAALRGAHRILSEGALHVLFLELNWGATPQDPSAARDCIEILSAAGFRFAVPGPRLVWRDAGPWLWPVSDIIAKRFRESTSA
jgi:FkbM family methyltransferase